MDWLRKTLGRLGSGGATRTPSTVAPAAPPAAPTPWRKLGNDALGRGDLQEAARCYAEGVLADPQDAAMRLNHGFVLLEQGQVAQAAERLQQALALRRPGDGCAPEDAHFLLGRAQVALGQRNEAVASLAAALKSRPDFPEALEEGVRVLDGLARHAEAAEWMRSLVRLRPTPANRLVLASQLQASGSAAEAMEILDQVCAAEPANVEAALLRSGALQKAGRLSEALAEAGRALSLAGPGPRGLVNRAKILANLDRHEEALADIDQALALAPGDRDALIQRCMALTNLLRIPEAIAAADDAMRQLGDDADLHFVASLTFLLAGDLPRGWASHEWRTRSAALAGKTLEWTACPRWRGEDLQGRTILLHGEQGLGDNIQFVRFANVVARMAREVVLMLPAVLEPLVGRALAPNCRIQPQEAPAPHADFHCPLMSVPAVLGTTLQTIPADVPYLRADPAAVQAWRERLGPRGPRVGIAWAGNPGHGNDRNRSMALSTFRALDVEGCRFLTAQPDVRESDRAALEAWASVEDLGRGLRDFDATAAYFEALDLVITVDTSVAHLAGALGRPVWILLPHVPDWRWLLARDDSPWYPTARLYRQPRPGDWASVLARVREDLAALVAAPERA